MMNDWKQIGYLKAAEFLERALERLLTFHVFPPEHARHLRTTNPIESPFAAVKLRTNAARRFRTPRSALHLLFNPDSALERFTHAKVLKTKEIHQNFSNA